MNVTAEIIRQKEPSRDGFNFSTKPWEAHTNTIWARKGYLSYLLLTPAPLELKLPFSMTNTALEKLSIVF